MCVRLPMYCPNDIEFNVVVNKSPILMALSHILTNYP